MLGAAGNATPTMQRPWPMLTAPTGPLNRHAPPAVPPPHVVVPPRHNVARARYVDAPTVAADGNPLLLDDQLVAIEVSLDSINGVFSLTGDHQVRRRGAKEHHVHCPFHHDLAHREHGPLLFLITGSPRPLGRVVADIAGQQRVAHAGNLWVSVALCCTTQCNTLKPRHSA